MAIGVRCCETCGNWDIANAKTYTIPPNPPFKLAQCSVKNTKEPGTFVCPSWKVRT